MRRLIFLIFFLFYNFLYAQRETAIINDPDGYTNIREGKGTNTKIVGRIEEGEFFYYEPIENESWWKVYKFMEYTGVYSQKPHPASERITGLSTTRINYFDFPKRKRICD